MDRSSKEISLNNLISHKSPSVADPIHLDQDVLPLIDRALNVEGSEDLQTRSIFLPSPTSVHTRGELEASPAKAASETRLQVVGDRNGNNKKEGKRARRRRRRNDLDAMHMTANISLAKRRIVGQSIQHTLAVEALPISQGAYVGKRITGGGTNIPQLQRMLNDRFVLVEWDGRTPRVLLDKNRRVIGVLAGRPKDSGWDEVVKEANEAMGGARARCRFQPSDTSHRRGSYSCLAVGVSHGGGRQAPGPISNSRQNEKELDGLLENKAIQRLAGFANGVLLNYAPKVYKIFSETKKSVLGNQPGLRWNFHKSIFPAATFNFGPQTVTSEHTDSGNFASGMCSITALGEYDPVTGGHLILFDLGLIIQFPPGSTILIPSAILRHGNIPIHLGETRLSFTQYFAGALVRWHAYGCRTEADFKSESPMRWQAAQSERAERVHKAAEYFSIFEELELDRKWEGKEIAR